MIEFYNFSFFHRAIFPRKIQSPYRVSQAYIIPLSLGIRICVHSQGFLSALQGESSYVLLSYLAVRSPASGSLTRGSVYRLYLWIWYTSLLSVIYWCEAQKKPLDIKQEVWYAFSWLQRRNVSNVSFFMLLNTTSIEVLLNSCQDIKSDNLYSLGADRAITWRRSLQRRKFLLSTFEEYTFYERWRRIGLLIYSV